MTKLVVPEVAAELRQPCQGPDLGAQTAADVARVIVRYDEALTCANGRIEAIDQILTQAGGQADAAT